MTAPSMPPAPAGKIVVDSPKKPALNVVRWLNDLYEDEDHKRWTIVFYRDRFWIWNGARWRVLDEGSVRAEVYEYFEIAIYAGRAGSGANAVPAWVDFDIDMTKMGHLMGALKDKLLVDREITMPVWFEVGSSIPMEPQPVDPREVVPTESGLLHAPSRQVWAPTPRFFNGIAVHYAYDATARCPQWEAFLRTVWPNDPETIRVLRQMFGYLLTQRNDLQKIFVLFGAKRGGKGTIIRILSAMLGDENVAPTSMAELKGDFSLATLESKTLAVMSDLRFRGKDDGVAVERMLKISGNDQVLINRKHGQPYGATLSTRILIASNELPKLYDESGAIQTRLVLLRFTESFLGREDVTLEARLRLELAGILNWSLDGLDSLKAVGKFVQPEAGTEELEMIEHLASPFQAFVQECCVLSPAAKRAKTDLYGVYRLWCEDNGLNIASHKAFASGLKAVDPNISNRGKVSTDGGRQNAYFGVDLSETGMALLVRWHQLHVTIPDISGW